MWPLAMFGYIDALPSAQAYFATDHGHLQGNTVKHGFDMSRHVVGTFKVVYPTAIHRRHAFKRGDEVNLHIGISVFLNDERSRRMSEKQKEHAVARLDCLEEAPDVAGDLDETLASRFDGKIRCRKCGNRGGVDGRQMAQRPRRPLALM